MKQPDDVHVNWSLFFLPYPNSLLYLLNHIMAYNSHTNNKDYIHRVDGIVIYWGKSRLLLTIHVNKHCQYCHQYKMHIKHLFVWEKELYLNYLTIYAYTIFRYRIWYFLVMVSILATGWVMFLSMEGDVSFLSLVVH